MTSANARQVGGKHYQTGVIEHWDIVALFDLDYFQGNITKYVMRWKKKGGIQDLEKAVHYLQKYIEVENLRLTGRLTWQMLRGFIKELEEDMQEEDAARAKVVETITEVQVVSVKVEPARRACEQCCNVLPTHAVGCPLAIGNAAACQLCGGLESHLPACPLYP